jgi:hypothetical protein
VPAHPLPASRLRGFPVQRSPRRERPRAASSPNAAGRARFFSSVDPPWFQGRWPDSIQRVRIVPGPHSIGQCSARSHDGAARDLGGIPGLYLLPGTFRFSNGMCGIYSLPRTVKAFVSVFGRILFQLQLSHRRADLLTECSHCIIHWFKAALCHRNYWLLLPSP